MPETRNLVNVEQVLVDHLKADGGLDALVDGKVSTKLPQSFPSAGEGRVQLFRATSTSVDPETGHIERAVVQVNTFGASKTEAWAVTAAAVRALVAARSSQHDGAVVSAVERVTGPSWSPDPSTSAPRYTSSFAVTVHPV